MRQKIFVGIGSNNKRIELKVGDEIQIELKAVGGTGYAWYFDHLDKELFELIGEERKAMTGEEKDTIGTPVISVWKIKTLKLGRSTIKMSYYRIWEGKDKAINQFKIKVDIVP